MTNLGDFSVGHSALVPVPWDTFDLGGGPVTASSVTVRLFKNQSTTPISTGVGTPAIDAGGTGLHRVDLTLTDGTVFAAGSEFMVRIEQTVNGVATRRWVARFSIAARATAAIKAKTDQLTFNGDSELEVDVQAVAGVAIAGTGIEDTDEWRPAS